MLRDENSTNDSEKPKALRLVFRRHPDENLEILLD